MVIRPNTAAHWIPHQLARLSASPPGPGSLTNRRFSMDNITREKFLKIALVAIGAIFLTIYPLSLIWPSGWQWHGGHGLYYLQMICGVYAVFGAYLIAAARNPSEHRSLISFTVWSSFVHASIMAVQAIYDGHEIRHLAGDVPALLLAAGVSGIFLQRGSRERSAHSNGMPPVARMTATRLPRRREA